MSAPEISVYLNRSLVRDAAGNAITPEQRRYQMEIRVGKQAFTGVWLCASDERAEANARQLAELLSSCVDVPVTFASIAPWRIENGDH